MFAPVCHITPGMAKALMSIEGDRQAVADLPGRIDFPKASRL